MILNLLPITKRKGKGKLVMMKMVQKKMQEKMKMEMIVIKIINQTIKMV